MSDSTHTPSLSSILGQPPAVEVLRALARRDDPSGAPVQGAVPPLLLHGPDGVGKKTAALAFAAALVCARPSGPGGTDACGRCAGCLRVAASGAVTELREGSSSGESSMVYPDVGVVSVPHGKTRISVLQARDVATSLSMAPYELPRRIYIVEPADRMNAAAANALLKILEEPPVYAVLVLVTAAPWALPITVRSRLRAVRFRPLPDQAVTELLVRPAPDGTPGLPADEAARRAAAAGGSMVRAQATDPAEESARVETWVRVLERLSSLRPAELAASAAEDLAPDAESAGSALDLLVRVLRDVAAADGGARPVLLDARQVERLAPLAPRLLGPGLERPGLVDRLRRELVQFNRNPRLSVEGAILALAGVLRARDLPA